MIEELSIAEDPVEMSVESVNILPSKKVVSISDIEKTIAYINRGVELNQTRLIQRAIRYNANIRKYITTSQLKFLIDKYTTESSPSYPILKQFVDKLPIEENSIIDDNDAMIMDDTMFLTSTYTPEVEIYIFTLLVTSLLNNKLDIDAVVCSTALVERIRSFNRRSLDLLASKAFFYFSLSYERIGKLENIRAVLLTLFRTACVHQDEISQSVLLNLLLRNYLQYNLIEQAHMLSKCVDFPENASNNQTCRYSYYMGRILAIQLEYSQSCNQLKIAARKAPQESSTNGFSVTVHKLIIIVQLLMGEIPERSLFNTPEFRVPLTPYFHLTQAVRNGDLQRFNEVMTKYTTYFKTDKCFTLVQRLGHNVLKTGLKKISISYSRISLQDIADKLHLPSASSAEYVCAKAIRDNVIEAKIDHENAWLITGSTTDLYSTSEPQISFHKRINYCLDVHNEAVKSMRYPPNAYKNALSQGQGKDKKPSDDEKTIEEHIKDMEDDMDE